MTLEGAPRSKESSENTEAVTRRGILSFAMKAAVALSLTGIGIGTKPAEAEGKKTYEQVVEMMIDKMEKDFGKNGPATQLFEKGEYSGKKLTKEVLSAYLNNMSTIAGALDRTQSMPGAHPQLRGYMMGEQPGLGVDTYPTGDIKNNYYQVNYHGANYKVTARHAMLDKQANGTVKLHDGYYAMGTESGPDVAIMPVNGAPPLNASISFDDAKSDAELSGKIGVLVGTDVHGNPFKIHTPFVKATLPVLRLLYENYDNAAKTDRDLASVADSYIAVVPPWWGLGNGNGGITLGGLSGGMGAVLDKQSNAYLPVGPFIGVKALEQSCEGQSLSGVCTTIGFVSTGDAVRDTIVKYNQTHPHR